MSEPSVSTSVDCAGAVVVGHDGSSDAQEATRSAAAWARLLGVDLVVLRAWNLTTAPTPASYRLGYMPPLEDFEAATAAALERDVAPVRAEEPEVVIRTAAVHRAAVRALVDASAEACLLVVGSRGVGGLAARLLGSTSDQVVRHAACSVLVHRPSAARRTDETALRSTVGAGTSDLTTLERALVSELKLDR